jgi:hypothetical protein
VTYGEYWRLSGNVFEFLIAALLKTVRIKLPNNTGLGRSEKIFKLEPADFPRRARRKIEKYQRKAEELGFEFCFYYTIAMCGRQEAYAASLRSSD